MISHVAVVIPANDEQDEIGRCLTALAAARVRLHRDTGGAITSQVVVALDACSDSTASIVAGFSGVACVVLDARCVGAARRAGTAHAIRAAGLPPDEVWIAGTDADCEVPADWLVRMAAHGDAGYDLVLGMVRPRTDLCGPVRLAWHDRHPLRSGHPHVHGANLGIRADAYLRLGGWPRLPADEDVVLVGRADADPTVAVLRTGNTPVLTSSRERGRVDGGFAGYLRALRDMTTVTDEQPA